MRKPSKEECIKAVQEHGSKTAAAAALKISRYQLARILKNESSSTQHGRSLVEFRNTYDKSTIVPNKIKDALRTIGSGWEYEVAFAKLAGVSLADLGLFRDAFAAHVVQIGREGRRAWAGTKNTAEVMRRML